MPDRARLPDLPELLRAEPDIVDRIFDYIASEIGAEIPDIAQRVEPLKDVVRQEFAGERVYISHTQVERQRTVSAVLSLFNGRNATAIARQLGIGRATVYRIIKQGGRSW